jgi:release factor glutamine methyltransferase
MTEKGSNAKPPLADKRDIETVYQPAEDSALLAESARECVDPGDHVLDVGTGSGYVAAELADAGADVVGVDISPLACREATDTGISVVRGNLVDPFCTQTFDLVVFNPPYLPTPDEIEWDDWMEQALSGGEDGRRLIDPFLSTVGRVLAPGGTILLLLSSLTDPEAVRSYAGKQEFDCERMTTEQYPYEELIVFRLFPE